MQDALEAQQDNTAAGMEDLVDQLAAWLKAKPEATLAFVTLAKGYGFEPAPQATHGG